MNLKEIRELIKLMNENDLSEITIEREGSKVQLKKAMLESMERMDALIAQQPAVVYPKNQGVPSKDKEEAATHIYAGNIKEIKSPMVGTFYRAASPDAAPFVEAGQMVEIGQVVCIVEAMKLMNEIKSEVKGKIVSISAENAQPIEFGQNLFTVEPA